MLKCRRSTVRYCVPCDIFNLSSSYLDVALTLPCIMCTMSSGGATKISSVQWQAVQPMRDTETTQCDSVLGVHRRRLGVERVTTKARGECQGLSCLSSRYARSFLPAHANSLPVRDSRNYYYCCCYYYYSLFV